MDADSLSREQWELVDSAGLLEEIDLELGRVGEAWRLAEEAIGKTDGVSLRGAKSGHYLGNGMVYEKAGGKFYEVARDGSRGSEISTKEIRARGAEVLMPMGEAYKLQVEYEQLLAQRGEVEEIGLQLGEKVKEERKPGGEDGRVLYQLAADGDAAVAGADNNIQQMRKSKQVWDRMGVESPEFKRWFGDWEARKQLDKMLSTVPYSVAEAPDFSRLTDKERVEWAKVTYGEYIGESVTNLDDGRKITFSKSGLTKTLSHNKGGENLSLIILPKLPRLMEQAARITTEFGRPNQRNIDLVHRYILPIEISGTNYVARFMVREVDGDFGHGYYYDNIVLDDVIKDISPSTLTPLMKQGKVNGESMFTISRWLSEVNDHSLVVDGDGRPLLMSQVDGNGLQFKVRQAGDVGDGYYLNARNLIDFSAVGGRDIPTLKAEGYDGIRTGDGFIVFDENQVKSIGNRGTFSKTDPRVLYQEGGQMPLYPVGGYDQTSGFIPTGEVLDSGWNGEVKPLLDAMERAAMDYERGVNYDGLDPETGKQLKGWLNDVRGDMAQVKHETVGWGNLMHDQALLNYNEQYGFDRYLNAAYPYQFFMTRSALNHFFTVARRKT